MHLTGLTPADECRHPSSPASCPLQVIVDLEVNWETSDSRLRLQVKLKETLGTQLLVRRPPACTRSPHSPLPSPPLPWLWRCPKPQGPHAPAVPRPPPTQVPVEVDQLRYQGVLRIIMTPLLDRAPFFGSLAFATCSEPDLSFSLKARRLHTDVP